MADKITLSSYRKTKKWEGYAVSRNGRGTGIAVIRLNGEQEWEAHNEWDDLDGVRDLDPLTAAKKFFNS